jgi:von Willebrand factor type A domain
MHKKLAFPILAVVMAATATHAADSSRPFMAPVNRTVYVTVTDNQGAPVTDLTAAELVVKEGGKDREIVKAEPASGRMRLALAVEERIVADTNIRIGIFEFVKKVSKAADISLILVGLSNRTVVDYTPDANQVLDAINKLTLNPSKDSNLAEGILEIAEKFTTAKTERPVLVVVALGGGQAGPDPRNVLDKLGQSGATMHSVTLGMSSSAGQVGQMADESGRERVLGDGPKQSGGRLIDLTATGGVLKALQQVADDLLSQYAITYVLPDGVKPNKRFNISTKRRGVTLRAPSTIPDR